MASSSDKKGVPAADTEDLIGVAKEEQGKGRKRGSVKQGRNSPGGAGTEEEVEPGTSSSPGPSSPSNVPELTPESPGGKKDLGNCFLSKPAATFPGPEEVLKAIEKPANVFQTTSFEFCLFGISLPAGRGGAVIATNFKEKDMEVSGGSLADVRTTMNKLGMAYCCKKGHKPEQPNQDNCFVCHTGTLTLCGVADGHGRDGHWVSHWVMRAVLYLLLLEVEALGGNAPGQEVLHEIFILANQVLAAVQKRDGFDTYLSGTTLTVCVLDREAGAVCCAWCGDSRATVGTAVGKADTLSKDHKPELPEEKKRIVAMGGEVVRLEGDIPHRVFKKGGETPGLAMSRALGDGAGHEVGVTGKPDIKRLAIEPGGYLLCCSDGVWEFIKNSEATKMVHGGGKADVQQSCERLCQESRKRWLNEDPGMTDDISGILVYT